MKPFTFQELDKPSLFKSIFGLRSKKNLPKELNNALSEKDDFSNSLIVKANSLWDKYKMDAPSNEIQADIEAIYQKLLRHYLTEGEITLEKHHDLDKLKEMLRLDSSEVERIYKRTSEARLSEIIEERLLKGRFENEDQKILDLFQDQHNIPEERKAAIFKDLAKSNIIEYLEKALDNERYSPSDQQEIEARIESFDLDFEILNDYKGKCELYNLYWQLENGKLDGIQVDIKLTKNEECYFHTDIDWYELRKVKKRLDYIGASGRVKIAKGIYIRSGSFKGGVKSEDQLQKIDSGHLYLTNKRLIFTGNKGNKNIRLNKILNFKVYSDGVEIVKDTGKSPVLIFDSNINSFSILLNRAIDEY